MNNIGKSFHVMNYEKLNRQAVRAADARTRVIRRRQTGKRDVE